jgi:hypothetical protein
MATSLQLLSTSNSTKEKKDVEEECEFDDFSPELLSIFNCSLLSKSGLQEIGS